jgi:hypothetical protein
LTSSYTCKSAPVVATPFTGIKAANSSVIHVDYTNESSSLLCLSHVGAFVVCYTRRKPPKVFLFKRCILDKLVLEMPFVCIRKWNICYYPQVLLYYFLATRRFHAFN